MATYRGSNREAQFETLLTLYGVEPWVREYRFAPPRRFRFDFAWPAKKVAVEVDGIVRSGRSGHQTIGGLENDARKRMLAFNEGWVVFNFPSTLLDKAPDDIVACLNGLLDSRETILEENDDRKQED